MKQIPGISGYFSTKEGDIYSNRRYPIAKKMKTQIDRDGYRLVTFSKNIGRRKTFKVSRLIAMTFLDGFCSECVVMHLDNNRSNDNVNNLMIGTRYLNDTQKIFEERQARGEKSCKNKLVTSDVIEIKRMLSKKIQKAHIARIYGVTRQAIGLIENGKNWKHVK